MPPGFAPTTPSSLGPETPSISTPTGADPADHDDDLENDRTVLAPKKPRPQLKAPTGPAWVLVTPDGTREPIDGVVIVGRRPAKTDFPGADRSLILMDPDGQVSKSHAVFEVDDAGLWVRDLGSTNGVVVIAPTGEETEVSGMDRVAVPVGAEIELGGYVLAVEREE